MLTVEWRDDKVRMIDQTKLPLREEYLLLDDYRQVAEAICCMQVRGAPAIGVSAALGYALAAQSFKGDDTKSMIDYLDEVATELAATRPTAVNLFWALKRMSDFAAAKADLPLADLKRAIVAEAIAIQEEDVARNEALGRNGAEVIDDGERLLTHCNAGALACAGYGTALGVIRAAHSQGKHLHVYVDETRPLLQGARLTAWELGKEGIPHTLITDNMAGYLMALGKISKVIVGADRIAANGDTANKIGTYSVACLAGFHDIPFYVAAPTSTIDITLDIGSKIPIEERDSEEVRAVGGSRTAPKSCPVFNPAFDVTPHRLIAGIITEKGILRPPFVDSISALF